jgi:hypothetical protein
MKKHCIILLLSYALYGCGGSGSSKVSVLEPEVTAENTSIRSKEGNAMFDSNTELETGYQGLNLENVFIVDSNDHLISGNVVELNTKFSIVYEGVENYALKNGKAFPNLSMLVVDDNQIPVINETDLLASYSGGLSEEDASVLRAMVTVGDPMKPGKYSCTIQVIDKNNANAFIISTWAFEVK